MEEKKLLVDCYFENTQYVPEENRFPEPPERLILIIDIQNGYM